MNHDLITCLWLSACFLVLFGLGELLYHGLKIQVEYTRKFVHIGTGLLTLLFPLLGSHWYVLLLCASFAVILISSLRFNLLKSINAIDRKSHGSISYPIAVYSTFLFYTWMSHEGAPQLAFYYIPILTLAICDPIAALGGKRWPMGKYKSGTGTKTMTGSILFALTATVLCTLLLVNLSTTSFSTAFVIAITIGLATAVAEGFSQNGFDNLTIPATAMIVLFLWIQFSSLYSFSA